MSHLLHHLFIIQKLVHLALSAFDVLLKEIHLDIGNSYLVPPVFLWSIILTTQPH